MLRHAFGPLEGHNILWHIVAPSSQDPLSLSLVLSLVAVPSKERDSKRVIKQERGRVDRRKREPLYYSIKFEGVVFYKGEFCKLQLPQVYFDHFELSPLYNVKECV